MTISFELPPDLEQTLRHDLADLNSEAKESFLIGLYRRGRIPQTALSKALGLDRLETEDLLQRHHVTEDLGTIADYLADAQTLQNLRGMGS